ncbi:uncharacterized protein LOC118416688 isoform X1 [Branchiostoma floridae]|uniref:Uncharacterized protein LOC118416688 isoform X1 n=1 Tax=Branchiostoma floridae TaxID=7739 RepID=A0A9J7L7K6_BRAFL|nr:uncharacterized protein LOC118416688 isoform X1 [Branchiostoma floridae]
MRRSQTMATTKFDWKTKKKMLDDLEVGNKITPILIDLLQRKWVGPRALAGRFFSKKDEEEQDQEKTINSLKKGTAEDDLVVSEKVSSGFFTSVNCHVRPLFSTVKS